MSNQLGKFQQSLEKLDKNTTGGIGKNLVDQVQDGIEDIVAGVAQAPIDLLNDLIGLSDSASEDSTNASGGNNNQNLPPDFQKKMEEKHKKREDLLRQHRLIISQFDQANEERKDKEKQEKQLEEQDKQQKENSKIHQLQQQKRKQAAWKQAIKFGGGAFESGKKKG